MTITDRLETMKRNNLNVIHLHNVDVIKNHQGNYIVLYSGGATIDVIFYKTAADYINHIGVILCTKGSYSKCLELAQAILE